MAIVVLVVFSLAVALLIDGAVASFRAAGADVELARVTAATETALATGLEVRFDSTALAAAPGSVLSVSVSAEPDSVSTTVQLLAAPAVRVVVAVRSRNTGLRFSVGRLAYGRLVPDSTAGGELRIIPSRPVWWVPIP